MLCVHILVNHTIIIFERQELREDSWIGVGLAGVLGDSVIDLQI